MTIRELAREYFKFESQRIKKATIKSKISLINKNFIKLIDCNINIKDIQISYLTEYKDKLNLDDNISIKTKNSVLSIVKNIFKFGVYINEIDNAKYNQIEYVLQPLKNEEEVDDYEFDEDKNNFITYSQYTDLLLEFKYSRLHNAKLYSFITQVLFHTGLRKSELRGLKIKNIDIENKQLNIVSQKQSNSISRSDTTLKSKNSKRIVMLDDVITETIKTWIIKNKLKDNDYIISDCLNNYAIALNSCAKKIGVDRLTPHGLRHSHCSYLIQLYLDNNLVPDFGAIAKRLGHSVENTMNVYYHMYPQQQKNLIILLNSVNQ
ncbi:MAG: tyrosine-type recombinase/integrase [Candidatus Coprovivens sp.]